MIGIRRVDDAVIVRSSLRNRLWGGLVLAVTSLALAATVAQMCGHPFMRVDGAGWFAVVTAVSLVVGMTVFVLRIREFRVERTGDVTSLVRVTRFGPVRTVRRYSIDSQAGLAVERDNYIESSPELVLRNAAGKAVLHANEDQAFLEALCKELDALLKNLANPQVCADLG